MSLGGESVSTSYKHYGMDNKVDISLFGIERNLLDTVYLDYYYPSQNIKDPYGTNKNYEFNDVIDSLYDVEEYSKYE